MFTTRPEIRGTFGVVSSTHWLASGAGMAVLERGGNAFDAAVAAGFVLQVVEPHLNGPLGEVPILAWNAKRGAAQAICGQGTAPAAATIEAFRNDGYDIIPGSGLVAATVPGSFDAWMSLLLEHGTWRLRDVMDFAIGYAETGHPLVPRISAAIGTVRELFETHWPTSAAVYLPHGDVPAPGRLFRNPALAQFYRRLIEEAEAVGSNREAQIERARRVWSQGFVADAIDRFSRKSELMDGAGKRRAGFITGEDMARWRARVEKPVALDHHGWTVLKCGPWSQGPVMLQALAMLDGDDLKSLDPNGPEFIHLVIEALKLAMADREAWYADPDFVDVPLAALLSREYAAERRRLIGDGASHELRPGRPAGRTPVLPARPDLASAPVAALGGSAGEPTMARLTGDRAELQTAADGTTRGDTCHVDVIDRWGNMVAATPSGGWFQSSPVVPELGVCLGVRGQMFWLDPTVPGALAPGKRPRTTLTPSMALKDGQPTLAFGTPGGDQQDQWQTLFFLRHAHHGLNLQEAIDAPSCHSDHVTSSFWPRHAQPGSLTLERRFPAATIEALAQKGHRVEVGDDWSEGRLSACAIERDGDQRLLKAGANPRGMQGYAMGR
ncbi:gamma-glutamyltranspeptidase [Aliidongia dinghuensis]|uniref:Gamma-glutamyltranspeptidase n=1 Tax=Aliidongia dinghuensis TaxID=1867774 RepID=A0A8J3E5J1_9PROT|nr:gamma-glutamyltransferase family protein [Aliidongia dinghuensis]GGF36178.1 gamma-glutamyltranspeptidase [Aliidongia dinghuensis]